MVKAKLATFGLVSLMVFSGCVSQSENTAQASEYDIYVDQLIAETENAKTKRILEESKTDDKMDRKFYLEADEKSKTCYEDNGIIFLEYNEKSVGYAEDQESLHTSLFEKCGADLASIGSAYDFFENQEFSKKIEQNSKKAHKCVIEAGLIAKDSTIEEFNSYNSATINYDENLSAEENNKRLEEAWANHVFFPPNVDTPEKQNQWNKCVTEELWENEYVETN